MSKVKIHFRVTALYLTHLTFTPLYLRTAHCALGLESSAALRERKEKWREKSAHFSPPQKEKELSVNFRFEEKTSK